MLYSANDDPILQWLNFQSEHGGNFLRALADAAKMADIAQYAVLRPALVMFRAQAPEPDAMVVDAAPVHADDDERNKNSDEVAHRRHRFGTVESIREDGFVGFVPISKLQSSGWTEVPNAPGVYYVLRPDSTAPPNFLEESTGGHFKGKNPAVPVSVLEEKWVQDAIILNIGKAGPGERRTLRRRISEYMLFGQGIPLPKWGGRYIWQLQQSGNLLVCWKVTGAADPREVEEGLIQEFESMYGRMPFANLRH